MIKYIVQGGTKLSGSVTISGAKNAAVAILPATLLVSGPCRIENVPDISDVRLLLEILRDMGAEIRRYGRNTLEIDCTRARNATAPIELVRRIRASYYLIGAELGRFGHAHVAMPGGCNFGVRPIDQHIKGFEAMGAMVEQSGGYVCADAPKGGLRGGHVYLDIVSVGATMNILLAAVLCSGMTIIENCAKEPHIVDLANFLNAMGAQISGAGWVRRFKDVTIPLIAPSVVAGWFLIFMPCFYELTMSTLLYSTDTKTIGFELYQYQTYHSQQTASAMASAILIFVVLVNWLLNKLTKGKFSI